VMICSSLCRVPFIAVLLLGLGELTFYVVQFLGAGSVSLPVLKPKIRGEVGERYAPIPYAAGAISVGRCR